MASQLVEFRQSASRTAHVTRGVPSISGAMRVTARTIEARARLKCYVKHTGNFLSGVNYLLFFGIEIKLISGNFVKSNLLDLKLIIRL